MRFIISTLCISVLFFGAAISSAADYTDLAERFIQQKIKITGSLDVYDEALNKVRNLRLIEWGEIKEEEAGSAVLHGDFRDVNSGDILQIAVVIESSSVQSIAISGVKEKMMEQAEDALNKDFSQEEVHAAIEEYIRQKSEYSKTFDMFDPDAQKFLKLNFDSFAGDMRKFGILYIQTAVFTEAESGKKVSFDVQVENANGTLKIKTLKRKTSF